MSSDYPDRTRLPLHSGATAGLLAWGSFAIALSLFGIADFILRPAGYQRLNDWLTFVGYLAVGIGLLANAACLVALVVDRGRAQEHRGYSLGLWLGALPPAGFLMLVAWLVFRVLTSSHGLTAG